MKETTYLIGGRTHSEPPQQRRNLLQITITVIFLVVGAVLLHKIMKTQDSYLLSTKPPTGLKWAVVGNIFNEIYKVYVCITIA